MSSDSDDREAKKTGGKVGEKASFYSRDTEPFTSDTDDENTKKYAGVERRRRNRRSNEERRKEIRFELDKADRRQNPGRRKDDKKPKFW